MRGGGRGGHHSSYSSRGGAGRHAFRRDSSGENLPEWASEEPDMERGGSFDASGKFQSSSSQRKEFADRQPGADSTENPNDAEEDWEDLGSKRYMDMAGDENALVDEEEVDPGKKNV